MLTLTKHPLTNLISSMTDYPKRRGSIYTANIGLRIEPELKHEFELLKVTTKIDVAEAQRIALRELAQRLKAEAS